MSRYARSTIYGDDTLYLVIKDLPCVRNFICEMYQGSRFMFYVFVIYSFSLTYGRNRFALVVELLVGKPKQLMSNFR